MAVNRAVREINTDNDVLNHIQDNLVSAISILQKVQIINGNLIQNLSLASGANTINHGLARKPLGYIVVSSSASITYHDSLSTATDKTFSLTTSGATTASLWVF